MPDVLPDAFLASRLGRALHLGQHREHRDEHQSQDVRQSRAVERRGRSRGVRERRQDHRVHLDTCGSDAWDGARREP